MSLNAPVLCLLAALAIGGAAALLGLDGCRLSSALLPGLRPAAAVTAPALCAAWAAGLAFAALRSARRPGSGNAAHAGRWLAAGAAGAFAGPSLLAAWTSPAPPLSEGVRAVAAALPFMPALFCLGASLLPLLALRAGGADASREARVSRGAAAGLLGWLALGAALAAWRWVPLLADGVRPTDVAAGALAGAALLCGALAGLPSPARATRDGAPIAPTTPPAVERAAAPGRRAWTTVLELVLAGLACGLVLPALLRVAGAQDGDDLATRGDFALRLACGGVLGALCVRAAELSTLATNVFLWVLFVLELSFARAPEASYSGRVMGQLPFVLPALLALVALARAVSPPRGEPAAPGEPGTPGLPVAGTSLQRWGLLGALLAASIGAGVALCGLRLLGSPGFGTPVLLRRVGISAAAALALLALAQDRSSWRRLAAIVPVLGALLFMTSAAVFPWRADDPRDSLLRQVEDSRGVLSVVGVPGGRASLQQGGQLDAAEGDQSQLARRMGRISASFKPAAERAAVLGLGSGLLPASLAATSPAAVDLVEPSGARLSLFTELPYEAGQSGRAGEPTLANADLRGWLLAHPRSYDLIVGQPALPDRAGDAGLGSTEHALAMRAALREGGVAVQWYALERLPWPAFASAARAFLAVFPDSRLFVASLRADVPLVALVGGLAKGLPPRGAVDELLAQAPSAAGPPAFADLLDLYVCDAWTLLGRLREEPADSGTQPWVQLRSERRGTERAAIARTNLRMLAELSQPLDTTSFEARPVSDKENRQLGAELTARSAALTALLSARATSQELRDAEAGGLAADERATLENQLGGALLAAWKAAPGHLDVRDALAAWAADLVAADRWELAGTLLQSAVDIAPDARLLGGLGGVLLHLDHADSALALLLRARELSPTDRTVLVNLGTAQLFLARDAEARETLHAARTAMEPSVLPALPDVALRLLDGEQPAVGPARALIGQLPAGVPWRAALTRLLAQPPPGGPAPAAH